MKFFVSSGLTKYCNRHFQQSNCPQYQYHLGLAQKQLNTPKSRLDACSAFKQVLTKHCDSIADTVVNLSFSKHAKFIAVVLFSKFSVYKSNQ